jgi:hypothetical protein
MADFAIPILPRIVQGRTRDLARNREEILKQAKLQGLTAQDLLDMEKQQRMAEALRSPQP